MKTEKELLKITSFFYQTFGKNNTEVTGFDDSELEIGYAPNGNLVYRIESNDTIENESATFDWIEVHLNPTLDIIDVFAKFRCSDRVVRADINKINNKNYFKN